MYLMQLSVKNRIQTKAFKMAAMSNADKYNPAHGTRRVQKGQIQDGRAVATLVMV